MAKLEPRWSQHGEARLSQDGRVAANAVEISLITRTYVGRSEAVLLAAQCMGSAVLAGRRHLEVVYVLDDSPRDRDS